MEEDRAHDLGSFIREQRNSARLSLRRLSDLAGISNPYLSQIERGLRKPSAEILQQIARALEISAETLYIRAGILEERDGDSDVVSEIRRDLWISEEQKKTLIHIYELFRSETSLGRAERGEADPVSLVAAAVPPEDPGAPVPPGEPVAGPEPESLSPAER